MALAVLTAAITTAASALGRGGDQATPTLKPKPHVDIESLATKPGVPTDPKEREWFLRKEVVVLSANGLITVAQAQRALREIKRTGTLGGDYAPSTFSVGRLTSLPPQARVPAEVARFVAHVGELTGSAPADANSVRLLRRNLGKGHGDVYGLESRAGTPCFILTGYGGVCVAGGSAAARSGLAFVVGGGDDGLPGVFVGLAADDLRRVELLIDGSNVPVSLEGNVAFAELPAGARSGAVTTRRAGGQISSVQLPDLKG
ncbi:MAG TPA: hypothetical protein VE596_16240 [Gaiellaceae bacterium]|nr:hypothetical protein [Gaiellaceae bacterium]